MEADLAALDQVRSKAIDLAMTFGPKLLVAIIILTVGYFAARWTAGAVGRSIKRFEFEPPVRQLMLNIIKTLVFLLFAIMALQNLGVELLPLIAGIGVAGAGIALAMQGVLSNLVAGLTIILTRPFRVGEYISIAKEEGEVAEIRLANTTLSHADLSRVVIPNRRIVGEILHNYGQIRQLQMKVSVAYDADLNRALATISEVLQANARVLKDPAPVTSVAVAGGSAVTIGVYPWVRLPDYGAASSELNKALIEAFRERGIAMPPPLYDVRVLGNAGAAEREAA